MAAASIVVDLLMKTGSFETDTKRAEKALANFQKEAAQVGRAVGFAFAAAGAALVAYSKTVLDSADALDKLSQKTGVSVKNLAELELIAKTSDTTLEAVGNSFNKLKISIGQAEQGNEQYAESLKALGVTSRNPREALIQLADAVKNTSNETQLYANLQKVLGKSFTELLPLLRQGGTAIEQSALASQKYANAMQELAPAAAEFNDNITSLQQSIKEFTVFGLGPAIREINSFVNYIKLASGEVSLFQTVLTGIKVSGKSAAEIDQLIVETSLRISKLKTLLSELDPEKSLANKLNSIVSSDIKTLNFQIEASQKQLDSLIAFRKQMSSGSGSSSIPQGMGADAIIIPPEKAKASTAAINKYSQEIANLYKAAQDAIKPSQSLSESLQEQLDAFSDLEPSVKSYVQGLIDIKREQEGQIERQERIAELVQLQIKQNTELAQTLSKLPRGQFAELSDQLAIYDRQLKDNQITVTEYARLQIEAISGTTDKAKESSDAITVFWEQAARNMQDAMSGFFFDVMQGKLSDLAGSFKRTIDRMVADLLASQLLSFLGGSGAFGGFFSFLQPRANGGPVTANSPYLVGERGPELFVPSTSGRIIDANSTKSAMGGSVSVVNNFAITGAVDTRTQSQISATVGMSVNRAMRRNT